MEDYAQDEESNFQEDSLLDPDSSSKRLQSSGMEQQVALELEEAEEEEDLDRHDRTIITTSLPITRLDENVVNRIAAGEIIHRPANALKELIENSLDAGATLIKITLKDGGMKMLQIQDNGCGVRPADLPLLCERFATSKLREFSDLSKMTTFGFRGEALASISYVSASMSVVSKARSETNAYRASYASGSLVPSKPGQSLDPKPCAGTDGTTITAEDLFYNVPLRRRALKSAAEEYNRALEVAGKYAIHYGGLGVGFVCKKASSSVTDLSTPSSPTATTQEAIRMLHGAAVAKELVRLKPMKDGQLGFSSEGWISGANWSAKKTTFICFINHRLVDCSSLKRSLETVYTALLPKGGHPWIYLSLEIDPEKVDVNVHPTKKEVHFLNEDEIIEAVCTQAQGCLAGANSSRTFQFTQAILPGASAPSSSKPKDRSEDSKFRPSSGPASSQKGYPQHMVRVDAKTRTLDSMFGRPDQIEPASISSKAAGKKRSAPDEEGGFESLHVEMADGDAGEPQTFHQEVQSKVAETECMLSSIRELRNEIKKRKHSTLTEVMQNHTFVGVVDQDLSLSLLQQETKLYLVNHAAMIEEFAYQLIIRQFGNLQPVRLDPAPLVKDLVTIGLQSEPDSAVTGMPQEEIIKRITDKLISQSVMLEEYFSLRIDPTKGTLETIPRLLPRFPNLLPLERLPTLLLRLGPQVNWTDEKLCFESFARELAFAHLPATSGQEPSDEDFEAHTSEDEIDEEEKEIRLEEKKLREKEKWEIQHAWFASMRSIFLAPKSLLESQIVLVSTLPELYKVFERC